MTTQIVFDHLVGDFYVVEEMFTTLSNMRTALLFPEPFCKMTDHYPLNVSVNRLWKKLKEWRTTNHPKMARTLRDSMLGMSLGEARHAKDYERYSGEFVLNDKNDLLRPSLSRQTVYNSLHKFSLADVKAIQEVFDDYENWSESFGGDAWATICKYVQKYDEVDHTTFIDIAVHAVHNGGCAFDKGLLVRVSNTSYVQLILDQKFAGSILDLKFLNLMERIKEWVIVYQGILNSFGILQAIPEEFKLHQEHEYNQIEWNTIPSIELEEDCDRESNCYECGCYNCECEAECEECGEWMSDCVCNYCNNCEEYDCACGCEYQLKEIETIKKAIKNGGSGYANTAKGIQEKAKKAGQSWEFKTGKIIFKTSH